MSDLVDIPVDVIDTATGDVADVVDAATDVTADVLKSTIDGLTDALKVTSESHQTGMADLSNRLARIEAHLVETVHAAAVDAVDAAGDVVDAAGAVPEDAAAEVEAIIEKADVPPEVKRRGMIGAMSKKKGRRS